MHRRRLIAYAGMAMPLAFLGLPPYVYVPATYAQLPAIGLTMTGLVLFGARLLDLLTDPAAGLLLDRWRYRVHPFVWMLIGAPLLGAGASWLFTPPPDAGALYLLLTVSLTYAGWTLVAVPYFAWGAELAETPSDHRRVATWREAGSVLGAVAALLLTAAAARDALPVLRDAMLWLLALALLMLVGVPRRPMANGIVGVSWTELWRHTPSGMRRLLGLHLLNATAASMPATLFVLYAAQVLQLSERHTGILLLLYFLSAVAALPLWLALARRVGESDTWLLAILLCAVAFLPAAFLGTGDADWFALVCLLTGATLGADIAMPAALQAQLARAQSERLGMPRHASAFGLWGMASKLAMAAAAGISLPLLSQFDAGEARSAALPWLYAWLPASIKLLVAALLWRQRRLLLPADIDGEVTRHETNATDNERLADAAARRL